MKKIWLIIVAAVILCFPVTKKNSYTYTQCILQNGETVHITAELELTVKKSVLFGTSADGTMMIKSGNEKLNLPPEMEVTGYCENKDGIISFSCIGYYPTDNTMEGMNCITYNQLITLSADWSGTSGLLK